MRAEDVHGGFHPPIREVARVLAARRLASGGQPRLDDVAENADIVVRPGGQRTGSGPRRRVARPREARVVRLPVPVRLFEHAVDELACPHLDWARGGQRTPVVVAVLEGAALEGEDVAGQAVARHLKGQPALVESHVSSSGISDQGYSTRRTGRRPLGRWYERKPLSAVSERPGGDAGDRVWMPDHSCQADEQQHVLGAAVSDEVQAA